MHEKLYDKSCVIKFYVKILCCYNNKHDASMSVFCFYRHLSLSKHVGMFFDLGFLRGQAGSKLEGVVTPQNFNLVLLIKNLPGD